MGYDINTGHSSGRWDSAVADSGQIRGDVRGRAAQLAVRVALWLHKLVPRSRCLHGVTKPWRHVGKQVYQTLADLTAGRRHRGSAATEARSVHHPPLSVPQPCRWLSPRLVAEREWAHLWSLTLCSNGLDVHDYCRQLRDNFHEAGSRTPVIKAPVSSLMRRRANRTTVRSPRDTEEASATWYVQARSDARDSCLIATARRQFSSTSRICDLMTHLAIPATS
jgi:hypothetical protein